MAITNLQEKFTTELCIAYDAEHRYLDAQQQMVQQASNGEVQGMFQSHID